MKILLISPNYSGKINCDYFPLGLAYIASFVESKGHQVVPLNLNNQQPGEGLIALGKILETQAIDIIGLGGLTPSFLEIEKLIRFIRNRTPAIPIVLGGGITSAEIETIMTALCPDYAVVGEGEIIFSKLLNALENGIAPLKVPGLWLWHEKKPFFTGKIKAIEDLDNLPLPNVELFGMNDYLDIQSKHLYSHHLVHLDRGKCIPVIASRSCPFKCSFCHHAGMGRYRERSITALIEEITSLKKNYPAATFYIYDELFAADKKRISEFCTTVIDNKLNINWMCQLRVDQLDQDILAQMKKSGCNFVSYGFESGCDAVLKSMRKKITTKQIRAAVTATRQAKIGFQANFLYGDPAENIETVKKTLQFQDENELFFVDWSAVIPYPGTKIYQDCLKKGLIKDKIAFIKNLCRLSKYLWNDMINMTTLDDETFWRWYVRLREINDLNHRKRKAITISADAKGAFLSEMTLECPSCKTTKKYQIFYPPECLNNGRPLFSSAFAVLGLNILCTECYRKMHLPANEILHIGKVYAEFQKIIDQLTEQGQEVVLLPALDRFEAVFTEDINLNDLNVTAVLDSRPKRLGKLFIGQKIESFSTENIVKNKEKTFLILPWTEYDRALKKIQKAGIERVISWNRLFMAH